MQNAGKGIKLGLRISTAIVTVELYVAFMAAISDTVWLKLNSTIYIANIMIYISLLIVVRFPVIPEE